MITKDKIIGYEELRDIQRYEISHSNLAEVPEDFYRQMSELINRIKKEAEEGSNVMKIKQYENVKRIITIIQAKREEKIVFLALKGIELEKATPEEVDLYNKIKDIVQTFRMNALGKGTGKVFKRLRILKDVEQYTGTDNNIYGPFKIGEEVSIPEDEANWLIKAGYAELLEK